MEKNIYILMVDTEDYQADLITNSNNCFTKNDLKTSLNIANFTSYDNH